MKTALMGFNFKDFHAFVPAKVELDGRSKKVVREARGMVKSNYKNFVNRLISSKEVGKGLLQRKYCHSEPMFRNLGDLSPYLRFGWTTYWW